MKSDLIAIGCPEERIRVHYYGSDTRRFRHIERSYVRDGPPTILCCGSLQPKKGQNLVLQALRRVERNGHDFRVVIVGEGSLRPELERLIRTYGWKDRVTLTGHVPYTSEALTRHFRDADIFALPSITVRGLKEGIPGVVVEAMASGLPVVSTYHAGIPAVIVSNRHGLLVRERDLDALAGALESLLVDANLRERLGRAAAERAATTLDLVAGTAALERIYDSLA